MCLTMERFPAGFFGAVKTCGSSLPEIPYSQASGGLMPTGMPVVPPVMSTRVIANEGRQRYYGLKWILPHPAELQLSRRIAAVCGCI